MFDRDALDRVMAFHGHMCPGLAMGMRASEAALERFGPLPPGKALTAIVETGKCPVDAIQFFTGCTYGNGILIHRDHGKNAFTFVRNSDGKAIRVMVKANGGAPADPEWQQMFARVRAGTATPEEREAFRVRHVARAEMILNAPLDEVVEVTDVEVTLPAAPKDVSGTCAACGEESSRITAHAGRELCPPCLAEASKPVAALHR